MLEPCRVHWCVGMADPDRADRHRLGGSEEIIHVPAYVLGTIEPTQVHRGELCAVHQDRPTYRVRE
jgi:hypothetical protein